jgi:tungstate transport system substrate-binding protein
VIVHARALEDQFVADGFGVDRRDVMYNDFVVLDPTTGPAGIKGKTKAASAFARIAQAQALFVTRGDNSGTHVREMEIWGGAGIKPAGDWYVTYEKGVTGNGLSDAYGVHLKERRVTGRAVFIVDKAGVVGCAEYVPEIASHPNYDAALQVLGQAASK